MCPGSWGLSGKTRKIAELDYYYNDGEDKQYLLLEIDYSVDSPEYLKKKLELDKKYNKITSYDYDLTKLSETIEDKTSREYLIQKLELDKKHEKIKDHEYRKELADINHEPFFEVLGGKMEMIDDKSTMGFELDWNDAFVNSLYKQGWKGSSQEEIVNAYFSEICRQMLADEEFESYSNINKDRK
jgi:hypothetical protein